MLLTDILLSRGGIHTVNTLQHTLSPQCQTHKESLQTVAPWPWIKSDTCVKHLPSYLGIWRAEERKRCRNPREGEMEEETYHLDTHRLKTIMSDMQWGNKACNFKALHMHLFVNQTHKCSFLNTSVDALLISMLKHKRLWKKVNYMYMLLHVISVINSSIVFLFWKPFFLAQWSIQLKGFADPGYFICQSRSVFWMTANTISQETAFKRGCRKQQCKWYIVTNQSTLDKYMCVYCRFHDVPI